MRPIDRLWPALARSCAPYHHKLKVIRCKAWPRGLHAASGVHISPAIFQTLRASAGKGLRADKAGSNSQILLSLVHFPAHDPACFAVVDAILQFRRFADPSNASLTFIKLPPCRIPFVFQVHVGSCYLELNL